MTKVKYDFYNKIKNSLNEGKINMVNAFNYVVNEHSNLTGHNIDFAKNIQDKLKKGYFNRFCNDPDIANHAYIDDLVFDLNNDTIEGSINSMEKEFGIGDIENSEFEVFYFGNKPNEYIENTKNVTDQELNRFYSYAIDKVSKSIDRINHNLKNKLEHKVRWSQLGVLLNDAANNMSSRAMITQDY